MNKKENETFVITIIDTQNSTWQGTISSPNQKKTIPFRSALELIKLIDSGITKNDEEQ